MKNKIIIKFLLIAILVLALGLRIYKLDSVPPSISWDEAAVGYNAWTIANFGRDEYGKFFPVSFKSFGDDKHPIHIYFTALSVKLLGLSEFSVRFPSAIFGILNVFLIFFLARIIFKSSHIGLIASFFLAISPYNIHFSRFNHEANFALFFLMLSLFLFYKSLTRPSFLPLSILSFGITFITYHPAKIFVPIVCITLLILYAKKLSISKKNLTASLIVIILFVILLTLNIQLLGIARVNQTSLSIKEVERMRLFQLTHIQFLGRIELTATQYYWHFSPRYLFIQGDKNPRLSSQTGQFYKIDAIFLILGILYLIRKRSKEGILVLVWALSGPLPSSLVGESPHAARAMFMMGSWNLIAALGFYVLFNLIKKPFFKMMVISLTAIILALSLKNYLNYYYGEYAKRYAIEWQYGMKQMVEFVKQHNEYNQVFVTDIRSQPYIFFLYYLKIPLPDYLRSVIYNNNLENRSHNNVASFERFGFGGWSPTESIPDKDVLYIITPSQYDGLKYKSLFDVKQIIYYPNGTEAFYLISAI